MPCHAMPVKKLSTTGRRSPLGIAFLTSGLVVSRLWENLTGCPIYAIDQIWNRWRT